MSGPSIQTDPRLGSILLHWYDQHARDLPWRRTRDPYSIWISEIMLQQTRVEVVQERWLRFLARFPNVSATGTGSGRRGRGRVGRSGLLPVAPGRFTGLLA